MRRARGALLCVLVLATSGCYRWVPAELEATPAGTPARVVVTRSGADELQEILPDRREGAPVRGTFAGVEGDRVVLQVPVGQRQVGMAQRSINQRVQVPVGEVVSFERRELNGAGTAFLVAGAAGLTAAVIAVITEARKGDTPGPDTPPDESIIEIPIFSFLWGR